METFATVEAMRAWRRSQGSRSVGLVPTMGYLHEGHLSLVRAAKADNERIVVSIYVNPTQFGPKEDFAAYPRDLARDSAHLEREGTDVLFAPTDAEMYPPGAATFVTVEGTLTEGLCGASRPGHFRGVATVVSKLFHIIEPTRAYFGEKDAQQLAVLRRMTLDQRMDIEIVGCPIVREPDGLAMSSRNVYLSADERRSALSLSQALAHAEGRIRSGERDAAAIRAELLDRFAETSHARVDYVEFVDAENLAPVTRLRGRVLLALAVFIGRTRLIDNRTFEVGE
ncbi:pantoate--beta-alanine ligase [Candidatus Poribacteria bacterium]|nr:pantoate--beta-alanine ligase [Candidatus Poribacteria bacterium]